MVEPTESESKAELDRFVDAMIAIRDEIRAVEEGAPGSRRQSAEARAAHGGGGDRRRVDARVPRASRRRIRGRRCATDKYWPPVARVDNVYGDRNLFCSCIPVAELDQG